jgi:hypothetical protein
MQFCTAVSDGPYISTAEHKIKLLLPERRAGTIWEHSKPEIFLLPPPPVNYSIVTFRGDYRRGFKLNIGFIYHLQVVTTNRCNIISDFSYFTNHYTPSLLRPAVFSLDVSWQRLLTVDIPQLHTPKSSLHRLPYRTHSVAPFFFLITPPHGPNRKPRFQQYLYCCASIHWSENVFSEPLPKNGSSIFSWSLHSNGSTRYSILRGVSTK